MHVQTHIMSGWCVANCFALTPRERVFCMIAASIADVDGLGIVRGPLSSAYLDYHHVLAHSLPFGLIACAVLTIFSTHRIKALVLFLALFHLHLLLDYFGSGPGWDIFYLWPVSHLRIPNSYSWEFYSIQNISFAFLLFLWTLFSKAGRFLCRRAISQPFAVPNRPCACSHKTPARAREARNAPLQMPILALAIPDSFGPPFAPPSPEL